MFHCVILPYNLSSLSLSLSFSTSFSLSLSLSLLFLTVSLTLTTFIPILAPPFYTGTQLVIFCDVFVPISVDTDANLNLAIGVSYEKDGTSLSSGGRLMIKGIRDFGPFKASRLYRSMITISPLVLTNDLGQWTCRVSASSTNTLVVSSSHQSNYFLNEKAVPGKRVEFHIIILQVSLKIWHCFN